MVVDTRNPAGVLWHSAYLAVPLNDSDFQYITFLRVCSMLLSTCAVREDKDGKRDGKRAT